MLEDELDHTLHHLMERGKDPEYYTELAQFATALEMGIAALRRRPATDDYVKRSDVLDSIDDWEHLNRFYHPEDYEDPSTVPGIPVEEMRLRVKQCAPADVRPVMEGEWESKHIGCGHLWECSECHKREVLWSDFCPNCGAKMGVQP